MMMPISESLSPSKLRSLMLADPRITLQSSTIISLLWMYRISVTGIVFYNSAWFRRLKIWMYCSGSGIDEMRASNEYLLREMV